jgi:hypothetical protein
MLIAVDDVLSRDAVCNKKLEWRFISIMIKGFQT